LSNATEVLAGARVDELFETAAQVLEAIEVSEVTVAPEVAITVEDAILETAAAVDKVEVPEVKEPLTVIQNMVEEAYKNYIASHSIMATPPMIDVQNVRIFSTHVEVLANGISKTISLQDFKEVLDSLLVVADKKLQAFQLPYGCYSLAIEGSTMQIQCYYQEAKKTLIHTSGGERREYTVPFPNTIITHQLKKDGVFWQVSKSRYFCTNKTVPQLPDSFLANVDKNGGVYLLPIANMYETGAMCFGNNAMPMKFGSNLRGLDYYYQVLFDAPYNNDLGVRAFGTSNVTSWFSKWAGQKEFDYDAVFKSKY
jgi:hypothetical protein